MADRGDIDRVRESTDIVDLISEVTNVKKSGRSYMAVCPFHEEKTPSMSVDRARGLYHCFGCGKGGDVFQFVEETRGVDFGEALDLLATKAGITLVRDPGEVRQRGRRAAAIDALRHSVDVYHDRLKRAPDAGPARAYLRSRGYDVDIIDEWRLGFAGVDWDTLSKTLRTGGTDDRALADAGLGRKGRHGMYDVFRGRLMFPIYDLRGDPIGFGARKLDEVDRSLTNNPDAKYVNSADSIVYQKSRVLFGLDRARLHIDEEHPAVIVEGYTDVIAMHQAGVGTAVATCGTALGDGHFDLLRRFTPSVILSFDPDQAGSRAAVRGDAVSPLYRSDVDLMYAPMPDGFDPADLVQVGREDDVKMAIDAAVPLLEHRIRHEVAQHKLNTAGGRQRALRAAAPYVAQVDKRIDPLARDQYVALLARLVGPVDREIVEEIVETGRSRILEARTAPDRPFDRSEVDLLRVVFDNTETIQATPSDFRDERLRKAFAALEDQLRETPQGTPLDLSKVVDSGAADIVRAVALDPRPLPDSAEIKRRIHLRRIDGEIDELERKLAGTEEGTETHSDYLRRLIALQKEKRSSGE